MVDCPLCDYSASTKSPVGRHHKREHDLPHLAGVIQTKYDEDPAKWLHENYHVKGRGSASIADELNTTPSTLRDTLRDMGVSVKTPNQKKPVWFGMDRVRDFWYECWKHNMTQGTKKVWLHRLLAVAEYGYNEVVENDVHHKNEITWDNRPENLELMEHGEHRSHHGQKE